MFASRLVRLIAPAFRRCQPALKEDLDRHGRWVIQATSNNKAMMESIRRSFTTSLSLSSPSIKKTLTRTRDVSSRPRFAENRKSTVDSVLAPEEAVGIVLRPSTRDDCRAVYKYLLAQAEWEGCRDLVAITEEDLIKDGFGANPIFYCDVAEAHGEAGQSSIIGYGLYSFHFCAWDGRTALWENLFIHPEYRDLGIGSLFLHEVSKKMYGFGCRTINGYFDNNEIGLQRWYGTEGYENITEKHNFHLYSMAGEKLERYVNLEYSKDEYLKKAAAHGIHVESMITKKDSDNS